MKSAYLIQPFDIQIGESSVPSPGYGEVLIKLTMVGICGSDIHLYKNGHSYDNPLIIGHEGIGIIQAVGEGVSNERIGERVVIEPNIPCLDCPECWSGRGNVCRNKRIIGVLEPGCFTEYVSLPAKVIHTLPESISTIDAVAIEPATVALAALNRSGAKPGDKIAVIGLGAIGMLMTHIATSLGYEVFVTEIMEPKIKKAVEMGATYVPVDIIEKVYAAEEPVVVFECAGAEKSATMAIEAAPRGVDVILLGLSEAQNCFNPRSLSRKGNNIIPSLIYDHPFDFKRCIRLVEKGIIHPGQIISCYYALDDLKEALEHASKGTENKIVIRISEETKQ